MNKKLMVVMGALLLAGTSMASAQVRDDPPGWAWQRRGILDSEGVNPNRNYGGGYEPMDTLAERRIALMARAAMAAYGYGYRGFRADDPPGARYQDYGVREWDGY